MTHNHNHIDWTIYDEHLASAAWLDRRRALIAWAKDRCRICGQKGKLEIHHRSYKDLGNEPDRDLIVVCRPCHQLIHKSLIYDSQGQHYKHIDKAQQRIKARAARAAQADPAPIEPIPKRNTHKMGPIGEEKGRRYDDERRYYKKKLQAKKQQRRLHNQGLVSANIK